MWLFLLAMIPVPLFWLLFKFRLRYMIMGIPAILLSILIEYYDVSLLNGSYMIFMIVFIAPMIEESAKLVFTLWGKEKAGPGVGMMFAVIENAMYYISYGYMFWFVFLLREFQDPILHTTTATLSSRSWKKQIYFYPIAIGMHMFYNLVGLSNSILYMSLIGIAYFTILFITLKYEKITEKIRKFKIKKIGNF